MSIIRTLLLLILILFIDPTLAIILPQFGSESEEGQQTAKGINNGIVYLMAIPYILVALVSWRISKIYKS